MNLPRKWTTQVRFYRIFFLSTLKLSVLISLFIPGLGLASPDLGMIPLNERIIGFIHIWLRTIPFFGLAIDFIYKELTRKEEYFFYYNQGIDKYRLWAVTFLISLVSCTLLNKIVQLCADALK